MSDGAPDDEEEDEPFVVRLGDGPALVLARMEVAGNDRVLIDQASLRPDLTQTTIARRRADALGLSPGQGVMLQLARRPDGDGDPWGPCELVALAVDDTIDPDADDRTPGLLLGRDFLQAVWVTYVGAVMVMITRPTNLEG
jgi:hypothetical protein